MVADKAKKTKVEDEAPDHIDGELVLSIEKLQEIQDEIETVNEEASEKVLEVEQKYNEIRRPIYKRRTETIQSIPDFWLTAVCYAFIPFFSICFSSWESDLLASERSPFGLTILILVSLQFLSHPVLGDLLNEEDQKIFKYLVSLDVEDSKDVKSGYSITFNFSPNPYFEDTCLTKTYSFFDEGTTNITGTTIKWKEGMNVANGVVHKKEGGKRPLLEESFFAWFSEAQQKNLSEGLSDEMAEIIKEDFWPNPLKYFNNEADEEDFGGDEYDDEKGTDLDGEDESGGDEDGEGDDS